jgi:hypothetical protein
VDGGRKTTATWRAQEPSDWGRAAAGGWGGVAAGGNRARGQGAARKSVSSRGRSSAEETEMRETQPRKGKASQAGSRARGPVDW